MKQKAYGWAIAFSAVALVTVILLPFRERMNSTPVALSFLLVVLFTAAAYGSSMAVAISIVSVLFFNYFFLLPYGTLRIADSQNWAALGAFLITSLMAGSLSARVKRRAEEAERKQAEIERLYIELQEMFKKAGAAEAMKESEQLKSALLDAVTHDLRTPLTSMKVAVTTLLGAPKEESTLDEEGRREMLEVINAEIDRLNHHLEGLIEIAKLEAGAMQPRRSWSNIEEIVSISLARASGITSHHLVRVELEDNLPPVRLDEKGIAEVLYLLLENAAKYAPVGSEILMSVRMIADDTLKVSVEDQGPGISADLREKVFDKFFRAPSVDAHPVPAGLGMGLAIARGIVDAHKGRIWIEDSSGGRGTTVSFSIPLKEQDNFAGSGRT